MSSPMTPIVRGRIYIAGRRFTAPGIYVWTGKDHIRVLPLPRWVFRRGPGGGNR